MDGNDTFDVSAIAEEVLAALDGHRQIQPFSSRAPGLTLAQSYRVAPILRSRFETRGESIVGRKIGFTNREMWKAFGVQAPIWGYATDRTTSRLAELPVHQVRDFVEPRIEPEIMFRLNAAPAPGMDEIELLDCVEWISLGYEIVQSIFPNWRFSAPDTVAANGLHGALLVGTHHPIGPDKGKWRRTLAAFEVELRCNEELNQRGGGALVLGSPLAALRHMVDLLAKDTNNPPLEAGETVSTGTLTVAMPVGAGQTWTTKAKGAPFEPITIEFA